MQNETLRDTSRVWDFLEPAMNPNQARTDHIVLKAAASDAYIAYRKGQIVKQKNDGSNEFAVVGTSGYGGPARIIKYSCLVNDEGKHQLTDSALWDSAREIFEGSIDAYYQGFFKTQDLTGSGGTNEIQTLTFDADVDGGTYTLTWRGYTTANIAWNANAAAIKAAMLAAIPDLVTADITVAGTGPYTFTFTGVWAGSNVELITIDISDLTDGGVAVTGDTTAIVESTAGAGILTGVGRLVRGTASSGIMELGTGAPA